MVRFYILPNADHLTEDELNFEITLRNVNVEVDAKLEDKRRALRYAYKTERTEPKLYDTGLKIKDEATNLENVLKTLKRSLRESFDYGIVSRLRHYLIRLSYSNATDEEEKEIKSDCCKQIEEILRAYRQRVTYDPEHLNDDTDLDLGLGEGAKGLKDSWRNPNPKALVQGNANSNTLMFKSKTEEKSRTGTWPKERKGREEDNRNMRSDPTIDNKCENEDSEADTNNEKKSKRSGKEKQEERKGETRADKNDKKRKQTSEREKRLYKTRTFYSSAENSDSHESEMWEHERKDKHREVAYRSRGRCSTASTSDSSTEHDNHRRFNRYRRFRRSITPPRRYRDDYDNYYRSSRSRVENWDIVFTGDTRSMQVEDFLNRAKKLAKHERVGKRELLDKIHYKLKGEASDWWFTREDHCRTWETFENEIRFRFGNPNRDRGIRAQLRELRQKRGETFVAFVTEVEKLNQCLKHPHSSRTVFEIVWENMRPHYKSKLATTRVKNLEHLLDLNHRIDATDPNLYRSGQTTRNEIQNIDAQGGSENEYSSTDDYFINALQRKLKISNNVQKPNASSNTQNSQAIDTFTVKCWNCQKAGHHWRTCNEAKLIFCYACGNLGRTTKTCERNHPQTRPNTQTLPNTQQQSLN